MSAAETHGTFAPGVLLENNIVRIAFFDEAGMSNPKYEPFVVVGGIILHADKQWKAIEKRLEELWYAHMPSDCPDGYPFHASELFSGGKIFDRSRFDRDTRWAILEKLVAIPAEFNLPVFGGYEERSEKPNAVDAYGLAFVQAAACVEAYMRLIPDREEVAMLILENNHQIRSRVRNSHLYMKDERVLLNLGASQRDRLWLTRIMGEPHFEQKSAVSPLQIADACVFVMKRHLMKKPDVEGFFKVLAPQIIGTHKARTDADEDAYYSLHTPFLRK